MKARKIVCVGILVHDEVFQVESLPSSGTKIGALAYQQRYGGPAATAAVAICRLGGAAAYWGRVGSDAAGHAAIRLMREFGVDCSGVAVLPEGRTLRAIVLVDARGERSIVSDRISLSTDPSVLPADDLRDVGAVLVDSRWPAGAVVALDRARLAGVPTVLDADGGTSGDNRMLIDKADHVVFSSEGLRDYAGDGEPESLLRRCARARKGVCCDSRGRRQSLADPWGKFLGSRLPDCGGRHDRLRRRFPWGLRAFLERRPRAVRSCPLRQRRGCHQSAARQRLEGDGRPRRYQGIDGLQYVLMRGAKQSKGALDA